MLLKLGREPLDPLWWESVVRVEDEDQVTAGVLEASVEGGMGAAVFLFEDPDPAVPGKSADDLKRPVGRPIVDDDDFETNVRGESAGDGALHEPLMVVGGHEHADVDQTHGSGKIAASVSRTNRSTAKRERTRLPSPVALRLANFGIHEGPDRGHQTVDVTGPLDDGAAAVL